MANPEHTPELDTFDLLTVNLYRSSFAVAVVALVTWSVMAWRGSPPLVGMWMTSAAVTLGVANLHLYDKRIRWLVGGLVGAGWIVVGLTQLVPLPAQPWLSHGGAGLHLVALSALALKEQFCFRVPGLRAVPGFLAVGVFASFAQAGPLTAVCLATAAAVLGALWWAKVRMPTHFDIGDRSRYQI